MDVDTGGWALLAVGVVAGVCLALVSGAVRDWLLDVVDAVVDCWWDLVDVARRVLVGAGLVVLGGLVTWAAVALVVPRLVE